MRIELSVDCALYFAECAVNDDNLASAATFLKGLQQQDIRANDLWRRLTLKQHGPRLFDRPLFPLSVDALDSLLRDHSLSQSHVAHSDTVTKWAFTHNHYATSLTIDVNGSGAIKTMSFHLVDNNVTKRAIEFLTASIDTPIMNKPRYYWHTAGLDIHINTKYNTITYTRERN